MTTRKTRTNGFYTEVQYASQWWPVAPAEWDTDPDAVIAAIRKHKREAKTIAELQRQP